MSDAKNSHVLLEVIRKDGTISKDKKEVLLKWHSDFEKCFNGMKDDPDLVFDGVFLDDVTKLKEDFDKLLPEEQMSDSMIFVVLKLRPPIRTRTRTRTRWTRWTNFNLSNHIFCESS